MEPEELGKVRPTTILQFARATKVFLTFGHTGVAHWAKHTWARCWVVLAVCLEGKGKANGKTGFQAKADHRRRYIVTLTSILDHDLDILKEYVRTKNEVCR